ncbi:MAG TPA: TatD family hydrolase, partial [Gemmatimonadaceae bacterium]|nr:TatD family hydrolase [Gemmatimonadaceae bacterium]
MPRLIDSHAHLADPAFDDDRDAVIERARATGVEAIVAVGESLPAAARARGLAAAFPRFVYHTAGVHPHDAAAYDAARDLPAIREELATGAVAVGECGLDYHYDHSPRELQRRAFAGQLALAAETGSAVIVH